MTPNPTELELKAVIPDPTVLRDRLIAAGAVAGFRGRMSDRRFDRAGELTARDEVLRVRRYHHARGRIEIIIGWKGPVRQSAEGYKQREEVELPIGETVVSPDALLTALGYTEVHAVDRYVEVYQLDGATLRLEEYPRMDPLLEIEGEAEAIERGVVASGISREHFTAEPLTEFVRRYETRSGQPAILSLGASQ